MSNLSFVTLVIGSLGTGFSLICLIVFLFRKRNKVKQLLKVMAGFFILIILSMFIQGFINTSDEYALNEIENNIESNEINKINNYIGISKEKNNSDILKDESNKEIIERENIIGIGISNKDFISLDKSKPSDVINDTTGNWKLSKIATTDNILEYVSSYYKANFSNDKEIHGIINFKLKTTTKVSKLSHNILAVTIHQYVDKEEDDAKKLFTGMVLGEYWIYLDNGDIQKIR